jgi:acetyl-CoA synthetase
MSQTIEALFSEQRRFPPPPAFAANAAAQPGIYEQADADWQGFWTGWARKLEWSTPFTSVLEWNEPFARWFADGTINASVNCLDRHVAAGRGDRVAFYFEGEPGDQRTITYADMLASVCRFANGLKKLGLQKGDRVAIYMPMIPEAVTAMLACARLGLTHNVIFGGFSPDSIIDRVNDAQAKAIITADGGWRRGKTIDLKANCDAAMVQTRRRARRHEGGPRRVG